MGFLGILDSTIDEPADHDIKQKNEGNSKSRQKEKRLLSARVSSGEKLKTESDEVKEE